MLAGAEADHRNNYPKGNESYHEVAEGENDTLKIMVD
jgi:hypothetical protein